MNERHNISPDNSEVKEPDNIDRQTGAVFTPDEVKEQSERRANEGWREQP